MFKIIMFAASYFMGQAKNVYKEQSSALTEQLVLNVRSFMVIILTSIGSLALFCSGFYALLMNIGMQLDQHGYLQPTATLVITLLLSIVSLGLMIYCLRPSTWIRSTGVRKSPPKPARPIESALSMLVMDFVKERQSRREHRSPTKD